MTFGVAIVMGTSCSELVAVFAELKVIFPLQFPIKSKEYPTGSERLTVPVSFNDAQTPNLSEVPEVDDLAFTVAFEQANGLETSTLKLGAASEKFLVMEVLVTVNESVPDRYPNPVDPNCAQILTSEPLASPKFMV